MKTIGFLLFDGFDLMDFSGPFEVFLTINRLLVREKKSPFFTIKTIGLKEEKKLRHALAYGGVRVSYEFCYQEIEHLDIFLVPGTISVDEALKNPVLKKAVAHLISKSHLRTSVCTGAFFLAAQGWLRNREWTTHFEDISYLAKKFNLPLEKGVRKKWVDSGDVVTSGGISSGIAMSLYLVRRFLGLEWAEKTAKQMDYQVTF